VRLASAPASDGEARSALAEEIGVLLPRERAAGRSLAGPHRDAVDLLVDGRDAGEGASSGQARSLLLALTLASLRVYRDETGRAAVALLDDLDSELDEDRAGTLCEEVARRGQALVTSAHPRWAESLRPLGSVYREETGRAAVALLDDLDSELDEERAGALCADVARAGQALVTSAHPGWAQSLRSLGRTYHVSEGRVRIT
jgi:DNA replication and repair protein RecF